MKKALMLMSMVMVLFFPVTTLAIGIEFAIGGWKQAPDGTISYKGDTEADDLDISDDLNYTDQTQIMARLKLDMPLLIPNIYLLMTPMNFSADGRKDGDFTFGDVTFEGGVDFYSKLTLNTYDAALYYGIPFLETATLGVFNVDLGLNLRIIDFEGKVTQEDLGLKESTRQTIPVPMAYVGLQVSPFDRLAVEGEMRGILYSGNAYFSLIGRVKVIVFGPVYAAAGYRMDSMDIDVDDFEADATFSGLFLEAGFNF